MKHKIVFVTSSQPSINPRLVKEADLLSEKGYEVVVIGQYWNKWATESDKSLLKTKKWRFIRVGGSPEHDRRMFLFTRVIHKLAKIFFHWLGPRFLIAELSTSRCYTWLKRRAVKERADFYIGHNPGGLAPAINAAKKVGAKCGFDAEDFHRKEYSDNPKHPDSICKAYLEEKYFPQANYLTTSSPLIKQAYEEIFPSLKLTCILNVFPKPQALPIVLSINNSPLKLFWFSQTLGHNRGIAEIITAIGLVSNPLVELHLLADPRESNVTFFNELASKYKLLPHQITYHSPVSPQELFVFAAKHDIGLASEPGFGANNNLALSNKLFTYIASGLAILYSDTPAQKELMKDYQACGMMYDKKKPDDLAKAINYYLNNRQALNQSKKNSYDVGQNSLNWEVEGEKFFEVLCNSLN